MGNNEILANGGGYAPKMDTATTKAISDWWNNLSKAELLEYLAEQPAVTADNIRNMLANENCTLAFGITFSAATMQAVTDFYTKESK